MPRRTHLVAALGGAFLAGCALVLDFDDFDATRPERELVDVDATPGVVDFSLAAGDGSEVRLSPAAPSVVHVRLTRGPGFTGAVVLSAAGLPPGVTATTATIVAGEDAASIALAVTSDVPIGSTFPVTVAGSNGTTSIPAPPIAVRIVGAPGSLDRSFGTDGSAEVVSSAVSTDLFGVALQPDGKLVTAALFYEPSKQVRVRRFAPDGTPDLAFGASGETVIEVDENLGAGRLAVLAGGGIAIVARSYSKIGSAVLLLDRDGRQGALSTDAGEPRIGLVEIDDLVAPPNDGFVVLGTGPMPDPAAGIAFARADAALDPAFGDGGIVDLGPGFGRSLAVLGDGTRLALVLPDLGLASEPRVVRLSPSAAFDPSFGDAGVVRLPACSYCSGAVRAQNDRVFAAVAGYFGPSEQQRRAIAFMRFERSGAPDPMFGSGGVVEIEATDADDALAAPLHLAVQPDGSVLCAGGRAVVRMTASGATDKTFGTAGKVLLRLAEDDLAQAYFARGLLLDRGGGIVVLLQNDTSARARLARYWQ